MIFDLDLIKTVYTDFKSKVDEAKKLLDRPVTYTEKVLYSHLNWNIPCEPMLMIFQRVRNLKKK